MSGGGWCAYVCWCVMVMSGCMCVGVTVVTWPPGKCVLPASVFATALGNQSGDRPSGQEQSKLESQDRHNPITTKCHTFLPFKVKFVQQGQLTHEGSPQ